ncbi:hypothetical protein ACFLTD_04830, partial [Elusimicrobiota bacterium]
MNENNNKKKSFGVPGPPPPVGPVKKKSVSSGFGLPPLPDPFSKKTKPVNGKSSSVSMPESTSNELYQFETKLIQEREQLIDRIREREDDNLRLQEKFLQKEKEETLKRQQEMELLKKRLEEEYSKREQELSRERNEWKGTLEEIKKESRARLILEKSQTNIKDQAFQEARLQVAKQMEEMKKELEAAKRTAYEEKIKQQEEEKNTIRIEQSLKDVIQNVSSRQKMVSESEIKVKQGEIISKV